MKIRLAMALLLLFGAARADTFPVSGSGYFFPDFSSFELTGDSLSLFGQADSVWVGSASSCAPGSICLLQETFQAADRSRAFWSYQGHSSGAFPTLEGYISIVSLFVTPPIDQVVACFGGPGCFAAPFVWAGVLSGQDDFGREVLRVELQGTGIADLILDVGGQDDTIGVRYISSFTLNGTANATLVPIPEPTTVMLVLSGIAFPVIRRLRRSTLQ